MRRERHVGAAEHEHLALDAAQVGQRVAGGEAAAVDDGADLGSASSPERIGDPLPLQPVAPARRGRHAGRDAPRRRRTGPARKRPARSGSSAAMPSASSVSWPRRCGARSGRARRSSRPRATTRVPRRGPCRHGAATSRRLLAETDDRLLGALALAAGREHAAGPPRAGVRAGPAAAVDDADRRAAVGELGRDREPGDAGAEDGDLAWRLRHGRPTARGSGGPARAPARRAARSAARIAACSQACAARATAAASGRPRARPAAIAEDSEQPVPWVLRVAMRGASKRQRAAPSVTRRSVQQRAAAVTALHQHGARAEGERGAGPGRRPRRGERGLALAEQARGLGQVRGEHGRRAAGSRRRGPRRPVAGAARRRTSPPSPGRRRRARATRRRRGGDRATIAGENSMPTLTASHLEVVEHGVDLRGNHRRARRRRRRVTARVFCAVIAVIDARRRRRRAPRRSSGRPGVPAPPPLSDPAIVSAIGDARHRSLPVIEGWPGKEVPDQCLARSLRRHCPDQVRWVGARASQPRRAPQRIGGDFRRHGAGMQQRGRRVVCESVGLARVVNGSDLRWCSRREG